MRRLLIAATLLPVALVLLFAFYGTYETQVEVDGHPLTCVAKLGVQRGLSCNWEKWNWETGTLYDSPYAPLALDPIE